MIQKQHWHNLSQKYCSLEVMVCIKNVCGESVHTDTQGGSGIKLKNICLHDEFLLEK